MMRGQLINSYLDQDNMKLEIIKMEITFYRNIKVLKLENLALLLEANKIKSLKKPLGQVHTVLRVILGI